MRELTEMKKMGLADAEIVIERGSISEKASHVSYSTWDGKQKVVVIGDNHV